MKTSSLYGPLPSLYNQFGNSTFRISSFLVVHSHDRTSSITRVHTTTWDYFTKLAGRFIGSSEVVKGEIMTDINDLVQGFWTSSNGAVGTSLFAMRRLLGILQRCFELVVCFDIIIFCDCCRLRADNNLQELRASLQHHVQSLVDRISLREKFKTLLNGYGKMIDQSFSISKDLGDILRFLPGVVVQKNLSMQGMADLYRVKLDFLRHLKSIGLLRPPYGLVLYPGYILDNHLSGFLQDRDRSQLYYCDPELQHISICRQILSLPDRSNHFFDLQP